jgi:two-component system, OmpR family, sensor kinase
MRPSARFRFLTTLRWRLAGWVAAAMLASLAVFGVVVYVVATREEAAEAPDAYEPPEEIAADTRNEIIVTMVVVAPLAVLLASVAAFWLTRRIVRPIDEVVRAASEMSAEDLHRRLPVPRGDDELAALIRSLNDLFARLERGYTAQSNFASDASHELRTPLAVMLAELEVALRRPRTPEEWEQSAAIVLSETQRAIRTVEALLRYARAGVEGARLESVDARQLVEHLVDRFAPAAAQSSLGLTSTTPEPGAQLYALAADADALETALGGVLANALRYTPAGGSVQVVLEHDAAHGKSRIHVDDSGLGVAVAERDVIFRAFVRGERGLEVDLEGDEAGSGLGLAMARRICEAHGGTLSVQASPLGGARFTFELAHHPGPNRAVTSTAQS